MFLQVCVILLMGGRVVAWGSVVARGGHVWLPGGIHGCAGGIHGCRGHAWLLGGVRGCWGACVGYDKIRSMSGRYASYWNTFLLFLVLGLEGYFFVRSKIDKFADFASKQLTLK